MGNNKGQSTIEFIMSFYYGRWFYLLFLKMAINFTDGYMVHHATYLASRAYLVVDEERDSVQEGDDRAFAKAKAVFTKYLPSALIPAVSVSDLKEISPDDAKFQAFIGLWIQYKQKFSIGFVGGKELLTFTSESFLGREPSRSDPENKSVKHLEI